MQPKIVWCINILCFKPKFPAYLIKFQKRSSLMTCLSLGINLNMLMVFTVFLAPRFFLTFVHVMSHFEIAWKLWLL